MTPLDALNVLYQASRLAPLNAQTHEQVREAAMVLQKVVEGEPKEEKSKK